MLPTIYHIPKNQRIWVIRADGGAFFPHFRAGGVVAIGHADALNFPDAYPVEYDSNALRISHRISQDLVNKNYSKKQIASIVSQVQRFITDVRTGDLVVTPAEGRIMIGRIISAPYFSNVPVEAIINKYTKSSSLMKFSLRRKVSWGPVVKRDMFPQPVSKSLRANQSVFCIDEHDEAIYHLVYPVFVKNGRTHLSFIINQKRDIGGYSVSQFLSFLSQSEFIAEIAPTVNEFNKELFLEAYNKFAIDRGLSSVVKAQFFSNGDINSSFSGESWVGYVKEAIPPSELKRLIYILIVGSCVLTVLGGNEKLGIKGVFDILKNYHEFRQIRKETKNVIGQFIEGGWGIGPNEEALKSLMLSMPNFDMAQMDMGPFFPKTEMNDKYDKQLSLADYDETFKIK